MAEQNLLQMARGKAALALVGDEYVGHGGERCSINR
jgi:hypothetical protein